MEDVYQLRDQFSFNWRNLLAKFSVLLLHKNVVSELRFRTSAPLKLTYIFWRGQRSNQEPYGSSSKSIPYSGPNYSTDRCRLEDEVK